MEDDAASAANFLTLEIQTSLDTVSFTVFLCKKSLKHIALDDFKVLNDVERPNNIDKVTSGF